MRKIAIILYGPPGSGKGTQANLIADKLRLIHFDTGKFLESIWYDPKRQKEALVKREKKLWASGKLNTWNFTAHEVIREVGKIAGAGWGVVFSGSPRVVEETKLEIPVLEKLYGRKNIYFFNLNVSKETSLKRNSARLICTTCGYGLLTSYYAIKNPKACPVCGGKFYRRPLDRPNIIKVRLQEYHKRTEPVFSLVKKMGYKLHTINAAPAPYKVFREILKRLT